MSCVLRVTSQSDLGDFIATSTMPMCASHRKGEIPPVGRRGPYQDHGFVCDVSSRAFDDLPGQVLDALEFLTRYQRELQALRASHAPDDMRLDFAQWARIGDSAITQYDYFPPALLKHAGDLGIGLELSLYPRQKPPNQTS